MHNFDQKAQELAQQIIEYSLNRISMTPMPLDGPKSPLELAKMYGSNITAAGIGGVEALRRFSEGYATATLSSDHPRFLAFVPVAPSKAATLFDLVVSASSISGSTWIEGAGAIFLENEALGWLASLAHLPTGAGGTFVSGGSAGNLSGLVTAREKARRLGNLNDKGAILASSDAHSSVALAARILDVDVILVPGDENGKLTGRALEDTFKSLSERDQKRIFAVSATAGVTNTGLVDDLVSVSDFTKSKDLWLHVDAAYGGAGLCSTKVRHLYDGIQNSDSLIIDPHKWLFAPFDCAAILYRDPLDAAYALTQEASYLDDVNQDKDWNPSSFAYHLTRRTRGLPFWFSLATYGTQAYSDAVDETLAIAQYCRNEIVARPYLELALEPELTVVVFRRVGWGDADYISWSESLLKDQIAFVQPTTFRGERLMRLCFVNPITSQIDVNEILDTLAD